MPTLNKNSVILKVFPLRITLDNILRVIYKLAVNPAVTL